VEDSSGSRTEFSNRRSNFHSNLVAEYTIPGKQHTRAYLYIDNVNLTMAF
jgi:hypothetical protein